MELQGPAAFVCSVCWLCLVLFCVLLCVCRCRFICGGPRTALACHSFLRNAIYLIFWDRVFHWRRDHPLGEAGWPVSPRILLVSASQVPGLQAQPTILSFSCGCWVSDSSPHACMTNTLPSVSSACLALYLSVYHLSVCLSLCLSST